MTSQLSVCRGSVCVVGHQERFERTGRNGAWGGDIEQAIGDTGLLLRGEQARDWGGGS